MLKVEKDSEVSVSEYIQSDTFWDDLEFWVNNSEFEKSFDYFKPKICSTKLYGKKVNFKNFINLEFYVNKDKRKLEFYRSSNNQLSVNVELFNEIKLTNEPTRTYSKSGYCYFEIIDGNYQMLVSDDGTNIDGKPVKLKKIELHFLQLVLGHNVEKNKEAFLKLLKKSLQTKILNLEAKTFKMSLQDISNMKPYDVYKLVCEGKLLYFNNTSLIFDVAEALYDCYTKNVYTSRESEKLNVCVNFIEKNIEPGSIVEYMYDTNTKYEGVFVSSVIVDLLDKSYKKSVIKHLIDSGLLKAKAQLSIVILSFIKKFSNVEYIFEFLDTLDDSEELTLYVDFLANCGNVNDPLNKFKLYKMFRFK